MKNKKFNKRIISRIILPLLLLILASILSPIASGEDVTPSVPINPPTIKNVVLASMPEKTVYRVGESLDLSGAMITLYYSTGTSNTTTIKSDWCEGFDSSTSGEKTVTVKYPNAPVTVSFKVTVKSESGIEISAKPAKLEYFVGESELLDGLSVSIVYSDGSRTPLTSGYTVTGFSSATAGEKTVTVSYKGFSATYKVVIKNPKLTGIELTSAPKKTQYFVGDAFDGSGIVVTAKYENGTEKLVSDLVSFSGFESTLGEHTVTVSYAEGGIEQSATYTVRVSEVVPAGIAIGTLPNKIVYVEGEEFDGTGLVVKVINNNGSEEILESGYTLDGFSSLTVGEKTITVNYLIFTTTFKVNVTVSAEHIHKESEYKVTKEPTCTESGSEQTECTVCFAVVNVREIPALGHTQGDWQVELMPTCTDEGLEKCICTVCGVSVEERALAALGHTAGEWEYILPPTCTEMGTEHTKCTVCGVEAEVRLVDALGHSFGEWTITKQPSCIDAGERERYCTVCADGKEIDAINPLGHFFSDWKLTLEPTALAGGTEERSCTICTFTERNTIPKLESKIEKDGFSVTIGKTGEVFPYLTTFAPSDIFATLLDSEKGKLLPTGEGYTVLGAFDLILTDKDGATFKADERMVFSIPFVNDGEYDYYILTTKDGAQINATIEDGCLVFSSTEGGRFGVVGYSTPVTEDEETTASAPDTDDDTVKPTPTPNSDGWKIIVLVVASVLLVGLVIAMVYMYVIRKYY